MSQKARPIPGQQYRHFKGNLYQVITTGFHSETNEEMVVYQALYGDFKVYIRPLDMFLETLDSDTYPEAGQETRFQLVCSGEEDRTVADSAADSQKEGHKEGVNPLLIQFLEADTCVEKLKIFLEMKDSMDEVLLTEIAASLDISTGSGTLEEQYESVQFALHTLAKYERKHR